MRRRRYIGRLAEKRQSCPTVRKMSFVYCGHWKDILCENRDHRKPGHIAKGDISSFGADSRVIGVWRGRRGVRNDSVGDVVRKIEAKPSGEKRLHSDCFDFDEIAIDILGYICEQHDFLAGFAAARPAVAINF